MTIEVKAKERPSSRDFKGLKAIPDLKGLRRRLVAFQGDRPFRTEDGIEALPIRDFLHPWDSGLVTQPRMRLGSVGFLPSIQDSHSDILMH